MTERTQNMNLFFILLCLLLPLFFEGCKKKLPEPSPERNKVLSMVVRCRKCRTENTIGSCKRINQILFNCPKCNAVINIANAGSKTGR